MGVFDAIPTDGSAVSVAVLSSALKVDEDLLGKGLLEPRQTID